MLTVRLRSEPSVTALVLDAIVFIVAFPLALDSAEAAWIRVLAGVFALSAAVLGVRSAILFYTRDRPARPVTSDSGATEKLREWFGTPVAAGKTLLWCCWASFLVSLFIGFVGLLAWGVQALFN